MEEKTTEQKRKETLQKGKTLHIVLHGCDTYSYQLLSDWLRGANANVDAISNR